VFALSAVGYCVMCDIILYYTVQYYIVLYCILLSFLAL